MLVGRGGREERLRNPLGPVRVMKRPCCKTSPTAPAWTDEFESPRLGGRPALGLCVMSALLFKSAAHL